MSDAPLGTGTKVCRIVYCGASECGKTTNLEVLSRLLSHRTSGKLLKLATETDRTLYFDMLTIEIGAAGRAPATRFELFTVPGQSFYHAARRRILREASGVVFVVDSRRERLDANIESLGEVVAAFQDEGRDLENVPAVLQLNKCDEASAVPRVELLGALGCEGEPYVEAVAREGQGVVETLRLIARYTLAGSLLAEPAF
jgi:signal recognition particle receptor subunit beta